MIVDPPFPPPYKTFEQTPDGLLVTETLANGTTRIVPADEVARMPQMAPEANRKTSGAKPVSPAGAGVPKPAVQPLAQGSDRAVMFLDVPFAEKNDAKRLGAKWDAAMRKWFVPHGVDVNRFSRWWPDTLKQEMKPFGRL